MLYEVITDLSSAASDGTYVPGTYSAASDGIGTVTVNVTVDSERITDITLDLSGETESLGQAARDSLVDQIMTAQSAEIDGVSGASATTDAVKVALVKALEQAKRVKTSKKIDVADGTYTAAAPGFSWTGEVTCDVTFKDNVITDIAVTEEHETYTGRNNFV